MQKTNEEIKKEVDEFLEQMKKSFVDLDNALYDALVYGKGFLPVGRYESEGLLPQNQNRVYSSILGKYIDARTGEVIND